jgi:hypothetical protein
MKRAWRGYVAVAAVFALTASLPFMLADPSGAVGEGLVVVGYAGLVLGVLVVQIREGLRAMRERERTVNRVAAGTASFLLGALAVFFVVLIPAASIMGTFDWLDDFPGPQWGWGFQLFLLAAVTFAIPAFVSGAVVVVVTATASRFQRERSRAQRSS